jgi:hypothetical protein
MVSGPSVVTLVLTPLGIGECDLCSHDHRPRPGTVVVRLSTGAAVEFATCAPCLTALQEVERASGGLVRFAVGEAPSAPVRTVVTQSIPIDRAEVDSTAAAFRREYPEMVQTTEGRRYRVHACGHARGDGTWAGWLEFHPEDPRSVTLRTGQETSQPSLEALAYWADGLEPVYFQGAFTRAH